jgi:hypothetical protein
VPVRITEIVWINHAKREFEQAVGHLQDQLVGVINVGPGVFFGSMARELRRAINDAYGAGTNLVCAACVTREDRPWSGSSDGP